MSKKLEELRTKQKKLREEICQLQEKEDYQKNKSLAGKFYKYRNCYSCPEGPEDYWTLYIMVLGVQPDGWVDTMHIQTDNEGKISITQQGNGGAIFFDSVGDNYIEIHRDEFLEVWFKMNDKLKAILGD